MAIRIKQSTTSKAITLPPNPCQIKGGGNTPLPQSLLIPTVATYGGDSPPKLHSSLKTATSSPIVSLLTSSHHTLNLLHISLSFSLPTLSPSPRKPSALLISSKPPLPSFGSLLPPLANTTHSLTLFTPSPHHHFETRRETAPSPLETHGRRKKEGDRSFGNSTLDLVSLLASIFLFSILTLFILHHRHLHRPLPFSPPFSSSFHFKGWFTSAFLTYPTCMAYRHEKL